MPTLSQTDLDNAMEDAQDLGRFMNDAAGTVATRTGGTIPNLKSLIATMLEQVVGTSINKTSAGDVTVTTERSVFINKGTPAATAVSVPAPESRTGGLPIYVKNVGGSVDYISNPTTITAPTGKFFSRTGTETLVLDGAEQWVELTPLGATYDVRGG